MCGAASLVLFGTQVYNPASTTFNWCYWMSTTATGLQFFAILFLYVHIIKVNDERNRKFAQMLAQKIAEIERQAAKQPTIDEEVAKYAAATAGKQKLFDDNFSLTAKSENMQPSPTRLPDVVLEASEQPKKPSGVKYKKKGIASKLCRRYWGSRKKNYNNMKGSSK